MLGRDDDYTDVNGQSNLVQKGGHMVRKRIINKPGQKSATKNIKATKQVSAKSKERLDFQDALLSPLYELQPDLARQSDVPNKAEQKPISIQFVIKRYVVRYNAFISPINNPRATLDLVPDPSSPGRVDVYFYETVDPSWKRYELRYIDSKPFLTFRFSMSEFSNVMNLLTVHDGLVVSYYEDVRTGLISVYIAAARDYR